VGFGIDLATGWGIKFKLSPLAAIGRYAISAYAPKINRSINKRFKDSSQAERS